MVADQDLIIRAYFQETEVHSTHVKPTNALSDLVTQARMHTVQHFRSWDYFNSRF